MVHEKDLKKTENKTKSLRNLDLPQIVLKKKLSYEHPVSILEY